MCSCVGAGAGAGLGVGSCRVDHMYAKEEWYISVARFFRGALCEYLKDLVVRLLLYRLKVMSIR